MPIQPPAATNIPFLVNYEPYTAPAGTVLLDYVKDMVSYNLIEPTGSIELKYGIGAEGDYPQTLIIKNITNNTQLRVKIEYDDQIFLITNPDTEKHEQPVEFSIPQEQTKTIKIQINKNKLDQATQYNVVIPTSIKLSVTNVYNATVVTKNISVATIPRVPVSSSIYII